MECLWTSALKLPRYWPEGDVVVASCQALTLLFHLSHEKWESLHSSKSIDSVEFVWGPLGHDLKECLLTFPARMLGPVL
eukprot:12077596-Ditylum_brightwellii.AAC.1